MNKKLFAFTINTLEEAENVILGCKTYKIKPVLHFKKYFQMYENALKNVCFPWRGFPDLFIAKSNDQ